jgi:hypothetical protein
MNEYAISIKRPGEVSKEKKMKLLVQSSVSFINCKSIFNLSVHNLHHDRVP